MLPPVAFLPQPVRPGTRSKRKPEARVKQQKRALRRRVLCQSSLTPSRSQAPKALFPGDVEAWLRAAAKRRQWLQSPDSGVLLVLAALVGAGTGLGVTLFKTAIRGVSDFGYGDTVAGALLPFVGSLNLIAVPTMGGACVSFLKLRFGALDGGIEAMLRSIEKNERFQSAGAIVKAIAAVFTLGSGCSLGPEGPSVEIGASVARLIPQWASERLQWRLSSERLRQLFACGCAAGVAAGFNAPFAGVLFANEIAQRAGGNQTESGTGASTTPALLVASALSSLVARLGLGERPAFSIPNYDLRNPLLELPLYLGLGFLAGVASLGFRKALLLGQNLYQCTGLRRIPVAWRPLCGGLLNGMVGFVFPQILFFGYDMLDALLADTNFSIPLLAGLLFLKPLMTAASLGSGLVGGTFAPALFVGANLGALYCKSIECAGNALLAIVFKTLGATTATALSGSIPIAGPPAYAMVGMAAVLAGMFRAPLTGCLLLFEMTRDYRIILPLMAGVGVSTWIADDTRQQARASPSAYATKRNEGPSPLYLGLRPDAEFRSVAACLSVRDGLSPLKPVFLDAQCSVSVALERFRPLEHGCILVTTTMPVEQIQGLVTVRDLLRAKSEFGALQGITLGEICSTDFESISLEEPLVRALEILESNSAPLLPVVVGTATEERGRSEQPNGAYESPSRMKISPSMVCGFVDLTSIERAVQFSRLQMAAREPDGPS
jgi:H+/Cl- antiporter ClcA